MGFTESSRLQGKRSPPSVDRIFKPASRPLYRPPASCRDDLRNQRTGESVERAATADAGRHDEEIESEFLDAQDLSAGQEVALEVLLVMADADARWGDYGSAVRVLDSVAATFGGLPAEYAVLHRRWGLRAA
jgi:hypothetical protein